jgi:hypothetical protein
VGIGGLGTVAAVEAPPAASETRPGPAAPTRGALSTVVQALTRMLAVGLLGAGLMLAGLVWDAVSHARDPGAVHDEGTLFTLANPAHGLLLAGGALAIVGLTGATIRALTLSGGRRLSSPRTGTVVVLGVVVAVVGTAAAVQWASTAEPPLATGPLAPAPGPDAHRIGIVNSHGNGPCRPTSAEKAAAAKLVSDTEVATARYRSLSAAVTDGYVGPELKFTQHFVHIGHMQDGKVLDPKRPEALMYTASPRGPVLVGVMYVMNVPGEFGPEPGGCLTRWHVHTNVCLDAATQVLLEVKEEPVVCPPGASRYIPPPLLHVWFIDVPGGRFAAEVEDSYLTRMVGAQ